MGVLSELISKYGNIEVGDITGNQKKELSVILSSVKKEEVKTLEEHEAFIKIVNVFRRANAEDAALYGKNFLDTLKSLLSVGEDGVYSNSKRFLYELIQNVDDCDYESVEDCQLEIKFVYREGEGKIILTYNEKGFTPRDVFSITGIAEKNKNVSAGKMEIGEKGIGFKSVFGIADRVLIESGMFSFELDKEDFTIPTPRYDGYTPVKGTRMTLMMSSFNAQKAFRSIMEQYKDKTAVINQNPILFLNKLTHLKLYCDNFRYIEFDVQREKPIERRGLKIEEGVVVSVDMKDYVDGYDRVYNAELLCTRYTMPIVYGKDECISRYGADTKVIERCHNLIAVFPDLSGDMANYDTGLMYSFLPTQIKINAPMVMHIPFKLDGSREYVDPQGQNRWFTYSIKAVSDFLKAVYVDLAHSQKQDVIYYIPNKHNYLFKKDNQKVECLCVDGLNADAFLTEKVFCVSDDTYESCSNVVAFSNEVLIKDPVKIYKLLQLPQKLFIPTKPTNMQLYNCTVLSHVYQKLFEQALIHKGNFEQIVEILTNLDNEIDYVRCLQGIDEEIKLSEKQLIEISRHRKMADAFINLHKYSISDKKLPNYSFGKDMVLLDDNTKETLKESVESAELHSSLVKYLRDIDYKVYLIDGARNGFALAGMNGLALSKDEVFGAFSNFVQPFDDNRMFSASLQIRQGSERLNAIDDSISNEEYMHVLRDVRRSLKEAFGSRTYTNYIQIINKAGSDKNRFLNELLQNADDCNYKHDTRPTFSLKTTGNIVEVTYNETGFTKQNVRAITAIGESTKNLLLSGETTIGEKGVGFKSVFGFANEVEIHSNGFDFKLTGKTPTIPEKCDPIECKGTLMRFKMKESILSILTDERILSLCLCLRKLKEVSINGKKLLITDKEGKRTISYNGKRYHFDIVEMNFEIKDEVAIEERTANKSKVINKDQKIVCYFPKEPKSISPRLYVGLPTGVSCNVPLLIDAPFELTTSRDDVLKNKWNELIREKLYEAILYVMESKKEELRIDIFQFIKFEKSQNGEITLPMFSDKYFNTCDWADEVYYRDLMPLAFEDGFVSLADEDCVMVSDVVAMLGDEEDIYDEFDGLIVDTYRKLQNYSALLEYLGVKRASLEEELRYIEKHADKVESDPEFRKAFYAQLSWSLNSMKNKERVQQIIKGMPVFPIKMSGGTKYVPFSNNIYVSSSQISDDEFLILDTSVMQQDRLYLYTGEHISELTSEVYEANYVKKLERFIQSEDEYTKEEKARRILREFLTNKESFEKCRSTLKGIIDEIPMKMASGNYQVGNKFINEQGLQLSGEIISEMYVDKQYQELAEYLGCEDILGIHYDDIDYSTDYITDTDIEEIQKHFIYYAEILNGYMGDKIITPEQIEKYDLQCYVGAEDDEDDETYEEFPGMRVKNLANLRKHIREQFINSPNPYVEKKRTERVPQNPVNDTVYTTSMYKSEYNENKCFCQMCKKMVWNKYIERNNVQVKPKYAWDQMYLSLCVTCSKDYILARNNHAIWERFIAAIEEADVTSDDVVEVEMGDRTISFTATHLAEIQEILKVVPEE